MVLPVLLAFGVIGWEQLQHTTPGGGGLPAYQVFHWFSDSLLALPLAYAAVWIGERLARQQRLRDRTVMDHVGRAALLVLVYAALLVPGAALHELADGLTQAHAAIGVHSHLATPALDLQSPAGIVTFAVHALSDGLIGQVVGFPIAFATLIFSARRRPARAPVAA
jgi:hypothetical protein